MMEMSQEAIDAIADEAYANGRVDALKEIDEEEDLFRKQVAQLREILEQEGDQHLLDAARHMAGERRAYQEAWTMQMQRNNFLQQQLDAYKQHAQELSDAIGPQQKKIAELNAEIVELRRRVSLPNYEVE